MPVYKDNYPVDQHQLTRDGLISASAGQTVNAISSVRYERGLYEVAGGVGELMQEVSGFLPPQARIPTFIAGLALEIASDYLSPDLDAEDHIYEEAYSALNAQLQAQNRSLVSEAEYKLAVKVAKDPQYDPYAPGAEENPETWLERAIIRAHQTAEYFNEQHGRERYVVEGRIVNGERRTVVVDTDTNTFSDAYTGESYYDHGRYAEHDESSSVAAAHNTLSDADLMDAVVNEGLDAQTIDTRPVVLDLDHDGKVELVSLSRSGSTFDVDSDGFRERTGWVSKDDGILTIDLNGDGIITENATSHELVFAAATVQEDTDLQALAAIYDKNHDGVLNKDDDTVDGTSNWDKFRIWQDLDGDGESDQGEVFTLQSLGITQFNVVSNEERNVIADNTITGYGSYDYTANGITQTSLLADVIFKAAKYGYKIETSDANGYIVVLEQSERSYVATGDQGQTIDLAQRNLDGAYGAGGNDYLDASNVSTDAVLSGGKGTDTLVGGSGNDNLEGGAGADSLIGGAGDDIIFFDRDDVYGSGGDGYDMLISYDFRGINLDLSASQIEIVRGGFGADTLLGESAPQEVHINGRDGDDLIIGGMHDDVLVAGGGRDKIIGNEGNDNIIADAADQIEAGAGSDTVIFVGGDVRRNALDLQAEGVIAGAGDDRLWLSSHVQSGIFFSGGGGADYLSGAQGDDILSGDSGDDALRGGVGNDVYDFSRGDGRDDVIDRGAYIQNIPYKFSTFVNGIATEGTLTVSLPMPAYDPTVGIDTERQGGGSDTIRFGANIAQSDLVLTFRNGDLYVGIKDPENVDAKAWELKDRLKLTNWADPQDRIEFFEYSDGTRANVQDLLIARGIAIPPASIVYTTLGGTDGNDHYTGSNVAQPDKFTGGNGNDTLHGNAGNDWLIGGNGDDSIIGGTNDDRLHGGAGNDTYLFGRGAGWDTLLDEATTIDSSISLRDYTIDQTYKYIDAGGVERTATHTFVFDDIRTVRRDGGVDTIKYGADVSIEDVAMRTIGDDMVIALREPIGPLFTQDVPTEKDFWDLSDQLRIINWADTRNRIEKLEFSDGTIIDISGIKTSYSGDHENEVVTGDQLGNWLSGGAGEDIIIAGAGADILIGGSDDDLLNGGDGNDRLYGGTGFDWVSYENAMAGISANIAGVQGYVVEGIYLDTLVGIENVRGSVGNDVIVGSVEDNSLAGGGGADTLDGNAGSDTAFFDESFIGVKVVLEDTGVNGRGYFGTAQGDLLIRIENLVGSSYSDTLVGNSSDNILAGDGGKDSIVGGFGIDTASYQRSAIGVSVTLNQGSAIGVGGDAEGDTLSGIENLIGSEKNDTLAGDAGNNVLYGGLGDDILSGGLGLNTLEGGAGIDWVDYSQAAGSMTVRLDMDYANQGFSVNDSLAGIDAVRGSAYADAIYGNTANNTLEGGKGADTLSGGDGLDTATYANAQEGIAVGLVGGVVQQGEALGDVLTDIENLIGSQFGDTLAGSGADNQLDGGAGNDSITGGAGNDILIGRSGADTLVGGDGVDVVDYSQARSGVEVNLAQNFASGEGRDSIVGVENVLGSIFGDVITGQDGIDNSLVGNGGNDTLNGGTGNDTMSGGQGSDVYYVDNANDVVIDDGTFGRDRVVAAINYTLGATIEDLSIGGTGNVAIGTGNKLDNKITGSNLNGELLFGLEGNDTIDGGGGVDDMRGGVGNDVYYVDISTDRILENDNEGTDSVFSKVNYSLSAYIENLTLTDSAVTGVGNGRDNIITGNDLANWLDGGSGNDTLIGGKGADTFVGGAGSDAVSYANAEAAIFASLFEGRGANDQAQSDSLSGIEGLIGGKYNDTLIGSTSDDTLNGGVGADYLLGSAGNDYYVIDNAGDIVVENSNSTADTIESSFNYTLGTDIETLVLNGEKGLSGTGNSANNTIYGGTGNDTIDGAGGADRMVGGAGNDVYFVDNVNDVVIEKTDEGVDEIRSTVNVSSLDAQIENLVLLGSARQATGNARDNKISVDIVNSGAATLNGGDGNDTLSGTDGKDSLIGGNGSDYVDYTNAKTAVLVNLITDRGTVSGLADTLVGIENAIGSDFNDTLLGSDQNNYLDGGKGADSMRGGLGDDVYIVDDINDKINEDPNSGYDRVEASVSYYLTDHAEVLVLTGRNNIDGSGNTLDNILIGNTGNNVLVGGTGNDTMIGGIGNDTYYVDTNKDVVTEGQGGGTDRIVADFNYSLEKWIDIEELQLSGSATITGTGNESDNLLIGNVANNTLFGLAGRDTLDGGGGNNLLDGGDGFDIVTYQTSSRAVQVNLGNGIATGGNIATADTLRGIEGVIGSNYNDSMIGGATHDRLDGGIGADTLVGGFGDDVYVVDNISDYIIELANSGRDLVESSIDYSLLDKPELEQLALTGSARTGTGNGADNLLIGNDQGNTLNGLAGADTLVGGRGNDYYVIDDSRDLVTEALDDGDDTVESSVDWTLSANIETIILAGAAAQLNGNDLSNRLTGNSLNNLINAGLGNDTIFGGAGNDTLSGDDGTDSIDGGDGNDSLAGGSGNDVIYGGLGDDVLAGGVGDDTIYGGDNVGDEKFVSDAGADYYYGGNAGRDVAYYGNSSAAIRINLDGSAGSGGTAEGDHLFEIDLLQGSAFHDTLGGSALGEAIVGLGGNDTIHGYGGNDEVNGNDGDDWLYGDDGDDNLRGNTGADYLDGGAGSDAARYNLATEGVWADLNLGRGLGGEALGDIFVSIENFVGSSYNDTLVGDGNANSVWAGAGNDSIFGGNGNDFVSGDDGNDSLYGDSNVDTLLGGNGDDLLDGGAYGDSMSGGAGNDILVAFANDTIDGGAGTDVVRFYGTQLSPSNYTRIINFEADGTDKIDLRDLFTQLGYTSSQRQFGSGFTCATQADGTSSVLLDLDRNGSFEFTLANVQVLRGGLEASDFIVA